MDQVESWLDLSESSTVPVPDPGQLLALVDALQAGMLNESQQEVVRALRRGIAAVVEWEGCRYGIYTPE
jgi:hypothetical protein